MILALLNLQVSRPQVEIGKGLRGSSYLAQIDALTERSGLPNLRQTRLSGTDFEIRVWNYFEIGANPLYGRVLRRSSMKYSGLEVKQPVSETSRVIPKPLRAPRSEWPTVWRGLTPLLTLRDEDELLPDDVWVMDGETTIVEIALPGRYRIYHHSNPKDHKKRKDAVILVRMLDLLDREFPRR